MNFFEQALRLIMPAQCVGCGDVLSSSESLCSNCTSKLKTSEHIEEYKLNINGTPMLFMCKACGVYTGVLRQNIHRFKFSGKTVHAKGFAAMLFESLRNSNLSYDMISYIPMTVQKQKVRGYNQSRLLAKELSRLARIRLLPLLEKKCDTKAQHDLPRSERMKNLKGIFKASEKSTGMRILLVDDVLTTGATMCECASELLKNGALEVYGICVAYAKLESRKGGG